MSHAISRGALWLLLLGTLLPAIQALAAGPATPTPVIAIIIDDLGNRPQADSRALHLPGPVACAILPHTPAASSLARRAGRLGKEVLLHQPLQSDHNNSGLGAGAITLFSTKEGLAETLSNNIRGLPHVVGVNNHMGSLITRQPGHMNWFMETLKTHDGLFFIDSYTTAASVALSVAQAQGVPSARRDVFLDDTPDEDAIREQFIRLKRLARTRGAALAIGHPHPQTLAFLERELPKLRAQGFELIGIAEYIQRQSAPVDVAQAAPHGGRAAMP